MTTTEEHAESIPGYRSRMTEEEFERWAMAEHVRAEWVEGEVTLMSPANYEHWEIVQWLTTLMRMYATKHDLGKAGGTDFLQRLRHRHRLPDVFFVTKARESIFKQSFLDGPADLIVEVVSPDSQNRDRREKYLEYEANGVREYWIIDPVSRQADFYILQNGKYVGLPVKDGTFTSHVLQGFWLKTEWLWQNPLPPDYEIAKVIGIV